MGNNASAEMICRGRNAEAYRNERMISFGQKTGTAEHGDTAAFTKAFSKSWLIETDA